VCGPELRLYPIFVIRTFNKLTGSVVDVYFTRLFFGSPQQRPRNSQQLPTIRRSAIEIHGKTDDLQQVGEKSNTWSHRPLCCALSCACIVAERGGNVLKSLTVKSYKAFGKGNEKPELLDEIRRAKKKIEALAYTAAEGLPVRYYEGEKLEIRPFTVLLGVNSIGKTSLLDALLLLQQTSIYPYASQAPASALKLNGRIVSLGEAKSLFHLNRDHEPFVLALELDNSKRFESYRNDFKNVLHETLKTTESLFALAEKKVEDPVPAIESLSVEQMIDKSRTYSKALADDPKLKEFVNNSQIPAGRKRPIYVYTKDDLDASNSLTKGLDSLISTNEPTTLELCFGLKDGNLFIRECSVLVADRVVISITFEANADSGSKASFSIASISSDLLTRADCKNVGSYRKPLEKMLQPDRPMFRIGANGEQERPANYFVELCWRIVHSTVAELEKSFSATAIAHIDADRGAPKRYYFTDPMNEETGSKAEFISILQDNERVRAAVDEWMNRFNLKIQVKALADMLHRVLVEQNKLDLGLDLTDVGFGVSQILPIIVKGFSAPANSLVLVEQPEAHLHPKMQADLADLFLVMSGLASILPEGDAIEAPLTDSVKKCFIIETHSEYLLKRLRLRVAQGKVRPQDVAIYFLSKSEQSDTTVLGKKDISSDGLFDWPEEFYATDLQDDLDLLRAQSARFRGELPSAARSSEPA
jgi:predicted ATPase